MTAVSLGDHRFRQIAPPQGTAIRSDQGARERCGEQEFDHLAALGIEFAVRHSPVQQYRGDASDVPRRGRTCGLDMS